MDVVRDAVLAGSWYPGNRETLIAEVDGHLAGADRSQRPAGRPLLAVAPHAGYRYSGRVAGRVLGLLAADTVSRIVIMAPSHRARADRILLSGASAFATPLGVMELDTEARDALAAEAAFRIDDRAHAAEHAIEILLPFLQRLWPESPPRILPALVPHLPGDLHAAAASSLAGLTGPGTLLLVSSDFTHYGADYEFVPFLDDIADSLEKLDSGAIVRILGADPTGLRTYGEQSGITMCGLEAAALALESGLPAGHEAALVDYARSGDLTGDYSVSVSYAGILICSGPEEGAVDA